DGRAFLLGAHQHAFHLALLGGGDGAAQALRLGTDKARDGEYAGCKQQGFQSHDCPLLPMGRTDVDALIERIMVACFGLLRQGPGTKNDGRDIRWPEQVEARVPDAVQRERTKTIEVGPLSGRALVVHRRSGTVTNWNGPGSAAHRGFYALPVAT